MKIIKSLYLFSAVLLMMSCGSNNNSSSNNYVEPETKTKKIEGTYYLYTENKVYLFDVNQETFVDPLYGSAGALKYEGGKLMKYILDSAYPSVGPPTIHREEIKVWDDLGNLLITPIYTFSISEDQIIQLNTTSFLSEKPRWVSESYITKNNITTETIK